MSDERAKQIKDKAYRLWEQEGQPAGRDLDHWVQAEREIDQPTQANEGEGNRTATRAYNRKAKQFAETGPVESQAQKAKADLDGPEAQKLREAELVGKSHSHGEDPAVKGS
ncbi:MAG TPA: DUF2934 domain-containing protein [Aliidongia sp.]|uniref:DUF2934 domain-containing protein n=1 Tax=Aliidongia sp. TaxID=1914230 RepID=UPI002DDCB06E|nr:DUF2934 domain-containing protein [Aliidongia sp.]HEV2675617.1 DUF2934 domain-containing protein [Aliidongia sp.]